MKNILERWEARMGTSISRRAFFANLFGGILAADSRSLPKLLAPAKPTAEPADAYSRYVRTSKDFQRVRQEKSWCDKAWPGWIYMPWTYQWSIGYTEKSGNWSRTQGYNGAFLDGNGGSLDEPPGKLEWINRFGLRFYVDHAAGKGSLHLWDGGKQKTHLSELHGNGIRTIPLNEALRGKLRQRLHDNIAQVKSSPYRAAYALDDEPSWGHFVHPTMWRITDEADAYPAWLKEIYGPDAAPKRPLWVTYEDIRPQLESWSLEKFDAGPLMDQWSFNDSYWCNFLGGLVEYSNSLDPQTPCGIVGGQAPNAFGGFDYAKLMRKIQFVEAYDLGSSQAIIRSFNPQGAIPAVTSYFHQSVEDDIWQIWRYLALGNRGHIGWVENWFDGDKPQLWHERTAPHRREAAQKIGPLMQGAQWRHDGIALYYSHPSIQLGWILDAQTHGATWVNRDGDHRLGASHLVRKAWENMLRDAGMQYDFLSYADVLQNGISPAYRVLILPACLCLSDAEAKIITEFCRRGGTVVADYLPGVWDQHGRGQAAGGALEELFGVRHPANLTARDVFGDDNRWCETDQDVNFDWKNYEELLTKGNTSLKDISGFHKAVRTMPTANTKRVGRGTAVLMNLSPQWYNAYRVAGFKEAQRSEVFLRPVRAGLALPDGNFPRWVKIEGAGAAEFGYEITYFRKPDGRTLLFVSQNTETTASELGGGNALRLKTTAIPVTLKFSKAVQNIRDERRGENKGSGDRFPFLWTQNEAIVLSFEQRA